MLKTRITELLGIEHPIMQGVMQWVATADIAAPASDAGALGTLSALTQPTPDALADEIVKVRAATGRPFAVNLTVLPSINPPPYEEFAQAIVDGGVRIVETSGSNPEKWIGFFKEHGLTVIHKCTSVRHAVKAAAVGADAVSVDGFECAGHPGEDDIPGLVLLPAVRRAIDVPIIATGGFANGKGLAAALSLGADAICMGTRFLCTVEAPVHERIKQQIVQNREVDTELIFRQLRNTSRVAKNSVSVEVVRILNEGGEFADVRELVAGARGRKVYELGDNDLGIWTVGMSQGLIDDIPTVAALVDRVMSEAEETIDRLGSLVSDEHSMAA